MAGFFKKLFNRIVGKSEEPRPAPEETQTAPPPPVLEAVVPAPPPPPEPEPQPAEPKIVKDAAPPPRVLPEAKPEPVARAKTKPVPPPPPAKPEPRKKPAPPVAAKPAKQKKTAPKGKVKPVPPPKEKAGPKPKLRAVEAEPVEIAAEVPPAVEIEAEIVAPPEPEPLPPPEPEFVPAPEPPPSAPEPEPPTEPIRPLPVPAPAPERKGWLARLKDGLSKSSKSIAGSITAIFTKRQLDARTLEELEDVLIRADLGLPMTERIVKAVSAGRFDKDIEPEEVKRILAEEVAKVLKPVETPFNFGSEKPFVILVVGVNGSGKTTTIGKLGAIAAGEGFSVMLAACDTFRAAAIEQLTVWGRRIGAETVSRPPGSDAAGLAFDALKRAREEGIDILIVDTAGRLQNKVYLMDELDKIVRVLKKQDGTAPHAVLLVLDATVGQNAIGQAEAFTRVAGVTGIVMTKLDGTARGGILVAIAEKFKLPIHAIGVGETLDDLQPFDAGAFARAIAGLEDA